MLLRMAHDNAPTAATGFCWRPRVWGPSGYARLPPLSPPYPPGQKARGEKIVVVELYTSQGCSSCPPADQIQAELADRDDVLPLTFPVDYWDYLGWRDTLARAGNAKRQMAYAQQSHTAQVFTPQMIIDGASSVIASRREEVLGRIAERLASAEPSVPILVKINGDEVSVTLPANRQVADEHGKASVWLFPFGRVDMVHIADGENRGRSVRYTHVVRDIVMMGEWNGKAATFEHALEDRDRHQFGYAVIVQDNGNGPILGATWVGDRGRAYGALGLPSTAADLRRPASRRLAALEPVVFKSKRRDPENSQRSRRTPSCPWFILRDRHVSAFSSPAPPG